ncbi:hypothetical protein H7F33_14300 [Pedobacter sp. PAMC26386]|nr:hypothetical protein H7F33_14300 [Pedobacter sp. PAMC26386]
MGRIRTIKPEFWTDEKVGKLKRDERLLFLGLLNLADDEGVLKATPAFIKGQIFAYDEDLTIGMVRGCIDALISSNMLMPFEYNGEKFLLVRTFKAHQKINRPTPSKIPLNVISTVLNEGSLLTHVQFSEGSVAEGKGKEMEMEQGKEGNKERDFFIPITEQILVNKIMNFFEFNEVENADKLKETGVFLACIHANGKTEYFKNQFDSYVEYKKINDSYIHLFKNFLGSYSKLFEDGAWNAENWMHRLKSEQEKNRIKNQLVVSTQKGVDAALSAYNRLKRT